MDILYCNDMCCRYGTKQKKKNKKTPNINNGSMYENYMNTALRDSPMKNKKKNDIKIALMAVSTSMIIIIVISIILHIYIHNTRVIHSVFRRLCLLHFNTTVATFSSLPRLRFPWLLLYAAII